MTDNDTDALHWSHSDTFSVNRPKWHARLKTGKPVMATGTHSHRLHELTTLLVHMDDRRSWMKLSEEDKTMSKTIDAHFDIDSPASYLAWTPTCFVDDGMFFGQDCLDWVEKALRQRPSHLYLVTPKCCSYYLNSR